VLSLALLALLGRDGGWRARVLGAALILAMVGFVTVQVVRHAFWWPAVALAGLLANRLAGLLSRQLASEDARLALFNDALWGVGIYLFAIAPTFYFPVPSLSAAAALPPEHLRWCGLPADLVESFFKEPLTGSWCTEPYRALAGGALYFLVNAFRGARRARATH
jgi:hypothetical protein